MKVKKIGKAVLDLDKEMWRAAGVSPERYMINRRLVDTAPEVKAARHVYSKASSRHTPTKRRADKRQAYMDEVKALRSAYEAAIKNAFEEIRKESFNFPIPLRLDKDYDHKSDWRYCMYEGVIYLFDRAGYDDEQMIGLIRNLEPKKENQSESA
jgi:hypothetical protein